MTHLPLARVALPCFWRGATFWSTACIGGGCLGTLLDLSIDVEAPTFGGPGREAIAVAEIDRDKQQPHSNRGVGMQERPTVNAIGTVAVGFDGSSDSRTALLWAAMLTAGIHGGLKVVHAVGLLEHAGLSGRPTPNQDAVIESLSGLDLHPTAVDGSWSTATRALPCFE